MKIKSLANRILLMVTFVVVVLTGLFVVYFAFHSRNSLERYQRDSGLSLAQSLAHSSALGMIAEEPSLLDQPFAIATSDPEILYTVAYDSSGKILKQFSRIAIDLSVESQQIEAPLNAAGPYFGGTIKAAGISIDEFYSPIQYQQEEELSETLLQGKGGELKSFKTVGFIRIGISRSRIGAAVRTAMLVSAMIGVLVLAIGVFLSFYISRLITRSLKELESGARRVSQGDLDVSLDISTDDEVGAVARAFNAMAGALKETTVSKDYVENIVGSMNEAMVVLDADRRIISLNNAAEFLLGYKTMELSGTLVDAVFPHEGDHPLAASRWSSLFAAGSLSNVTAELRTKDGRLIPVNLSAAQILDRGGKSHGLVCIARDMREVNALLSQLRAHAEDLERYQGVLFSMLDDNEKARLEIESERQKTLTAVNSMSDGLCMFGPDGRVILMNPAARGMLGIPEDAVPDAMDFRKMLGDAFAQMQSSRPGERPKLMQDITLGGTSLRTIRVEGIPLERGAELLGFMIVLRDITRQRRLDEAKYELIANVSHELRTPLAIISNVISNAIVGVAGPVPDKLMNGLSICQANAKRLGHIIDSLLDIAIIDAGRVGLQRENTDVAAIVQEKASLFGDKARTKGLAFTTKLGEGPYTAYCDRKAISDVVSNLILNAIRFTPSGGSIEVGIMRHGSQLEVSVTDTGIGIPSEEHASIFDHFHQLGRTYGPGEKGLGLGLAISRKIVEQHGGSIGLRSAVGKGSRFYFIIPASEEGSGNEKNNTGEEHYG